MLKIIISLVVISALTVIAAPVALASTVTTNVNVHRFYRLGTSTHFYTASETEAQRVRANMKSAYRYEGVSFSASSVSRNGLNAVYRFYNRNSNTHFYTTSATEAARVRNTMQSTFRSEGTAYYTNTVTSGDNLLPVFRFYNRSTGTHFYTASLTEKNRLQRMHSNTYRYESMAYGAARYYKNCTEARTYGVVPIYRNQPGYGLHLDRDGDGIACET